MEWEDEDGEWTSEDERRRRSWVARTDASPSPHPAGWNQRPHSSPEGRRKVRPENYWEQEQLVSRTSSGTPVPVAPWAQRAGRHKIAPGGVIGTESRRCDTVAASEVNCPVTSYIGPEFESAFSDRTPRALNTHKRSGKSHGFPRQPRKMCAHRIFGYPEEDDKGGVHAYRGHTMWGLSPNVSVVSSASTSSLPTRPRPTEPRQSVRQAFVGRKPPVPTQNRSPMASAPPASPPPASAPQALAPEPPPVPATANSDAAWLSRGAWRPPPWQATLDPSTHSPPYFLPMPWAAVPSSAPHAPLGQGAAAPGPPWEYGNYQYWPGGRTCWGGPQGTVPSAPPAGAKARGGRLKHAKGTGPGSLGRLKPYVPPLGALPPQLPPPIMLPAASNGGGAWQQGSPVPHPYMPYMYAHPGMW